GLPPADVWWHIREAKKIPRACAPRDFYESGLAMRFRPLPLAPRSSTLVPAVPLQQRHQQQCNDVDDLDQRIYRRACRILVRIAHRVTSYRRLVRVGALAAIMPIFDVFLGVR